MITLMGRNGIFNLEFNFALIVVVIGFRVIFQYFKILKDMLVARKRNYLDLIIYSIFPFNPSPLLFTPLKP